MTLRMAAKVSYALAGICLLTAVMAGTTYAAADIDQQRQQTAALKQEALDRIRSDLKGRLEAQYPTRTRLSVYVDLSVESFVLDTVSVQIDGRQLAEYSYTPKEAGILRGDALHRVLRTNVEPGPHKLRIDFTGHLDSLVPSDKTLPGTIEIDFDKGEQSKALILAVEPAALRPNRTLNPRTWKWRNEPNDPRLDMVRFLEQSGRNIAAILELLEIRASFDNPNLLPDRYFELIAHTYLDLGMRKQALQAYGRFAEVGRPKEVNDIRLHIAELDYKRGDYGRAIERLETLRGRLNREQQVRWQDLLSRSLMAEGACDAAIDVLDKADNAREVLTHADDPEKQSLWMRYNLAICLIKSVETARGQTLLDRVGQLTAFNEQQRALRDKANLVLAYHFLEQDQGGTAKALFNRIRLGGPYSDQGLLGLGWSQLAPRGQRQQRVTVGDEPGAGSYGYETRNDGRLGERSGLPERFSSDPFSKVFLAPFELADQADSEREALKLALIAWQALDADKRPVLNEAVAEAAVAVPYAYAQLGADRQARRLYEQAIRRFDAAGAQLAHAARDLEQALAPTFLDDQPAQIDLLLSADSFARSWVQRYVPEMAGLPWLAGLVAGQRFHEQAAAYRDLQLLAALVAAGPGALQDAGVDEMRPVIRHADYRPDVRPGWKLHKTAAPEGFRGSPESLHDKLLESAAERDREMRQILSAGIEQQRSKLKRYQEAARIGLATYYETQTGIKDSQTPYR